MNNKQKRRAVHMYQLGVYTVPPQDESRRRKVEPFVYEMIDGDYPYRKNIKLSYFDAFEPDQRSTL